MAGKLTGLDDGTQKVGEGDAAQLPLRHNPYERRCIRAFGHDFETNSAISVRSRMMDMDAARVAVARGLLADRNGRAEDFPYYLRAIQAELSPEQVVKIEGWVRSEKARHPGEPMMYTFAFDDVFGRTRGTDGVASRIALITLRERGRSALPDKPVELFPTSLRWDRTVGAAYVASALILGGLGVLVLAAFVIGLITVPVSSLTGVRIEAGVGLLLLGIALLIASGYLVRFQSKSVGKILATRWVVEAISSGKDPKALISPNGDLLVDGKGRPAGRIER